MPIARIFATVLLAALAAYNSATAQRFIYNPPGLDTARHPSPGCDTVNAVQHFQSKAKYPVGSEVLAARANAWLQRERVVDTSANGLVSFRFLVDCEGKPSGFYCEQSTLRWEPAQFPDRLVLSLYQFVRSLAPMPVGEIKYKSSQERVVTNYFTYFSFLFKNGEVQSVAP